MSESNTAVGRAAAALALFGERQRQPLDGIGAGQDRDQPVDELRGFPVAIRARAAGGDAAAPVPEHGARCAAGGRGGRNDGSRGSAGTLAAGRRSSTGTRQHEDLYVGQQNAGRVLLVATENTPAYRGFFRLLTEQHIPFAVSENLIDGSDDAARRVRSRDRARPMRRRISNSTCVTADACSSLARRRPRCRSAPSSAGGRRRDTGEFTIATRFPSLRDTDLHLPRRRLRRARADRSPAAHADSRRRCSDRPRKCGATRSKRRCPASSSPITARASVAYVPWDVGALYYRHSSPGHAGLMADVIDRLLPQRACS